MSTSTTVLIVGGGVAAGATASTLRDEGFTGRIVLVTDEPRPPYERPPLSKGVLTGDAELGDTAMQDDGWWDEHGVEVRTGRRVTDLGRDDRVAQLDDGSTIAWDRMVLATGASPSAVAIPGDDVRGVHHLRTADDALRLRGSLTDADHMVVVGGSWIGTEVAAAARQHGTAVTIVTPEETLLAGVLGADVGGLIEELHADNGVEVVRGREATRVVGAASASGVELDDGTTIDADAIVMGVGVTPNVELAVTAGLEADDGILVDASLRTSDDRILAIGDVANHDHPRLGRIRAEHVEVARAHGQTAARVLLGEDVVHDELPLFYSDQFDVGLEYVGRHHDAELIVRGDRDAREVVGLYVGADDVVQAGVHLDVWDATEKIRALIGTTVDRERLADESVPLDELP